MDSLILTLLVGKTYTLYKDDINISIHNKTEVLSARTVKFTLKYLKDSIGGCTCSGNETSGNGFFWKVLH